MKLSGAKVGFAVKDGNAKHYIQVTCGGAEQSRETDHFTTHARLHAVIVRMLLDGVHIRGGAASDQTQ